MAITDKLRTKGRAIGNVVLGTSMLKGTPFIEFYLECTDGENKGARGRYTGYFTEKTQERTIEALQTCGWSGDDLSEFSDGELHGLDTNEVELVWELESYEKDGETRTAPRVAFINRIGGYLNVENAMTTSAAALFGEKMRGLVLKTRSKRAPATEDASFNYGANAQEPPKTKGSTGRKF